MNLFSIGPFVVSWLTLFFGVFVYFKNSHANLNRIFSLICLSVFVWAFGYSQMYNTKSDDITALFWARLGYSGAVFIPVFVWHYIATFLNIKFQKWIVCGLYLLGLVFFLASRTNLFLSSMHKAYFWGYYPNAGSIYIFFVLFFTLVFLSVVAVLYYHLKLKKIGRLSNEVNRIKYLLVGFAIASTSLVDFLPNYGIEIYPWGYLSAFGWLICMWWATFKYHLMDIRLVLTRVSIFVLVYTVVMGIPFALGIWLMPWMLAVWGVNWWLAPMIAMAVLATTGPFLYIYLQRKAEDRLLNEQKRYQDTLKKASIGMTRIRDLDKLLKLTVHIVAKAVRLNFASIYIFDRENTLYKLGAAKNKNNALVSEISRASSLINWLITHKDALVFEEVKRQMHDSATEELEDLRSQMISIDAAVIIPSFIGDRLLAFMVLGDKRSGEIYSKDDLQVFTVLANQAALAIENARFFEEAKEMQEQIAQAEKMATIGTMADGLSHQINNRFHALSMIAGNTMDTIHLADMSAYTPDQKELITQIQHSLERIQANVVQGGEVVKGMLKYTRKGDAGLMVITLDKVLDAAIEMVQYKIKLSQIDIVRDYPKDIPAILGNLTQMQEVFFNLIDNAYDAMMERKDTLKEEGYRGRIRIYTEFRGNEFLKINVEDNGIGARPEDFKKMFTPFFTTKVSSRRGTGLGLYVIKKIVASNHSGRINVESTYKQGTRFTLEIPLAKNVM